MTEKVIIFDSGALISFSMNGITHIIQRLKEIFKGKFLVTSEIKQEIVDKPMKIRRFELEALKLKTLLDEGVLEGIGDGAQQLLVDEPVGRHHVTQSDVRSVPGRVGDGAAGLGNEQDAGGAVPGAQSVLAESVGSAHGDVG